VGARAVSTLPEQADSSFKQAFWRDETGACHVRF
jgi:hypothetical protein